MNETLSAAAENGVPLPRWNLSALYAGIDDPRIDAALRDAHRDAEAFAARYKGRIASLTPTEIEEALLAYESLGQEGAKPSIYAGLVFAADTSPVVGAFVQKVREKATAAHLPLLFFDLELIALGVERLAELQTIPPLYPRWVHYLQSLRDSAEHQLSEAEEKILAEKSVTGWSAFVRLYEEVTTNLRFTVADGIGDGGGSEKSLTLSEILDLQYSPDRTVRRASADALTAGLEPQSRTIAYVFNTLLHDKATDDRLRRYTYPEQSRHRANELAPEIVETVVGTAVDGYGLVARYYETKKRLLGLPSLAHYDRYAPLVAKEGAVGWHEAQTRILTAFERFDGEYADAARRFFDGGWIDAEPRPGKRGGAFCAYVTPDLHPVIFQNYLGKGGDVRTLAHELGHGIHNYLARNQGYLDFHGTLPMAEVASTFAEQLVFEESASALTDADARLAEYARQIEQAISTIFRQAALYRFEQSIHKARRESGELTVARFGELWQENVGAMFGDSVTLEAGHALWWTYVRHFVATPFYVYAYTFGEMLALALYRLYQAEGPSFTPWYLQMLRFGGSRSPRDLVAPLGVDLTDAGFWRGALDVLEAQIRDFETLATQKMAA